MINKELVNAKKNYRIGIIGQNNHGKNTLIDAICKVTDLINKEKSCQPHEISYSYVNILKDAQQIYKMITGMLNVDGMILVVSAVDGPMPQTREHLLLARQVGFNDLIVFINKADQVDEKQLLVVEQETKNLLAEYCFNKEEKTLIIKGSALKVMDCNLADSDEMEYIPIKELLKGLDEMCLDM